MNNQSANKNAELKIVKDQFINVGKVRKNIPVDDLVESLVSTCKPSQTENNQEQEQVKLRNM